MAIKDLFSKQKEQKTAFRGAHQESLDEFRNSVESTNEIKEVRREDNFIVPDLNYTSASNFAKFGSAEKYYAGAIKRIHTQYPYDGSNAEKLKFKNDLTQLERHVLDNQYPRSTGFITIAADGWGTRASVAGDWGEPTTKEYIQFYSQVTGTLYNTESNHRGNLHLNWYSGSCVEFWMKKDDFPGSSLTNNEAICQISGGNSPDGHQLTLFIDDGPTNANRFGLEYYTTTDDFSSATAEFQADIDLTRITTFADSTWHHYAVDFQQTSATALRITAYVDGVFDNEQTVAVSAMPTSINGALMGTLGATGETIGTVSGMLGGGKLSGSFDEFRFWRKTRTAQEIGRNYFTVINGGITTDTVKYDDDHPVNLGVYFKFNEGITGRTATDSVVLDYGGGLSNGAWTGYSSTGRSTESAITLAGVGTEKGDPIIYPYHPAVEALSTDLAASGSTYDAGNMGNLQNSVPLWMLDEDTQSGGELKNLLQIIGSYLDSLYLQVSQISKFQNAGYQDNVTAAANPHNNRLLTSLGFDVPEFFIDKTVLETIANQDDERKFEDKLNEIKNLIYKNIYNNLTYINKSKGTVKSIRNLLRCYGVDDDLFNFNVYADNAEFFLEDDYKNSSVKFDSIDLTPFSNTQNSEGVIYNFTETDNSDSSPYLSGSSNGNTGFTVQANVLFPKTPSTYYDSVDLTSPAIVTASVFGTRQANSRTNTTVANDEGEMTVYVVKDDNTAKFQLTSSFGPGVFIESDKFYDVYDNSQWNLSIRIKPDEYPFNSEVAEASGYTVEFAGYNYIQDILQNSFSGSATLSPTRGASYFSSNKRIYAGAERTNITGTLETRTNMKLLSVLAWQDYLEGAELSAHARDMSSYGRSRPYKNSFVFQGSGLKQLYLPKTNTLAMYWAFNQVTTSDASGEFTVPDLDSGSLSLVNEYGDYSQITNIQNTAQGSQFAESSDVKDIQYLNISTQQIPENLNTDNMIQILASDDDLFFADSRPVRYFFSMEASMYDTISREMLKTFAGVLDYASMIGSPIVEHQTENKELRIAREVFFSKVENTPDLQKYISLYKFLDSAIESVLFQLIPASADMSDRVRTVIESHIFERAHRRKHLIPGAKSVGETGDAQIISAKSGYTEGHIDAVPPPGDGPAVPTSCCKGLPSECKSAFPTFALCKKTKSSVFTKSIPIESTPGISVKPKNFGGGAKFYISTQPQEDWKLKQYINRYANKRFDNATDSDGYNGWFNSIAERVEAGLGASTDGDNKSRNSIFYSAKNTKIIEGGLGAIIEGDLKSSINTSNSKPIQHGNIILPIIQDEAATNLLSLQKNEIQIVVADDLVKNFVNYDVAITEKSGPQGSLKLKKTQLPVQFRVNDGGVFFGTSESTIVGHHRDVYYGNLEAPMQGPFPETHVGGYKSRHQPVGKTTDRPELFKVDVEDATQAQLYNPRIEDPAGTPTYNFGIPRVKFSREEIVKRVYNIRNIKNSSSNGFMGNFSNNYQVVMTNGRKYNNLAFVQQNGFTVTGSESTAVSGVLDFAIPTRTLSDGTNTETVIVNRFASPGSVATMAEGYLDADSGEFSPYNALPYRNLEVRGNLDTFWKTPSAFGGYQSGSTATASFLNIPRNGVKRLKYNSAGALYTASLWDNGFATHGIPNRDFGYSWITASADPDSEFNMDAAFGFATSSNGLYGITFYSGALRDPVDEGDNVINFAGYQTPAELITQVGIHYELNADQNLLVAPTIFTNAGTTAPLSTGIYFLNINGPYGYPSWKQIRGGEQPVARYLRENNYVLAEVEKENNRRVQQAPVSSKRAPILHNIRSQEVIGGELLNKDILLTYTFGNNYEFYGNYYDSNTSRLANPFSRNYDTSYKQNSLLYGVSELYTGERKSISLNSLYWNETIWPKDCNTYRSIARDRTNFLFSWKNSLSDRVNQITGSQASTPYSMWPMDTNGTGFGELLSTSSVGSPLSVRFGRYYLTVPQTDLFHLLTASAPQNTVQFGTTDSAGYGPFSNSYTDWNKELRLIAKDQSIIPEYRISEQVGPLIDSGFDLTGAPYQSLSLTGSATTDDNNTFLERYVHSDDIPSIEIVRETQGKDADRISLTATVAKKLLPYKGFYPAERTTQLSTLFSQSLGPNITLTGGSPSFQTVNNTVFSRLTYGSVRAGIATDTAIWKSGSPATNHIDYATGSFLITDVTELFTNGASTSLFAYVTLSSSVANVAESFRYATSWASGIGTTGEPYLIVGDSAGTATELATATALAINASSSYFNANSLDAQVTASAIFSGEYASADEIFLDVDHNQDGAQAGYSFRHGYKDVGMSIYLDYRKYFHGYDSTPGLEYNPTASWSRLPFETIVSPASYLNTNSSLKEKDPENPFDSTASVGTIGQKYEFAASNFYAGVVDSFIEGSNLTTIQSAPETEWTFDGANNVYSMDIVISKDKDFSNHDDPAANGAPYTAHASFYQPLSASSGRWWDKHIIEGATSVNGDIPPNAAWSENEAYVRINFDYNQFKSIITDREPTLNDVLKYSTKTFANKQMLEQLGSAWATSTASNGSQFMTIEAGVDLFNYNGNNNTWQPTVRWECPVHNYTNTTTTFPDGTSGGTGTSAHEANRGVWHQYSSNTSDGLRLFVRGPDTAVNRDSGSLAQACGFETKQKPIGVVASTCVLKEYLVAIPFVTNECDEEVFFHYDIDEFERAYAAIGKERTGTMTQTLSKMKELILPIKFNFMDKRDTDGKRLEQEDYLPILPPFAMYIFEITEELDQTSVSKIWQGVLPVAGQKAVFEKFNIDHKIEPAQIISPATLNNDLFKGKLPKEMRFKIFKAKHRSNLLYSQLKERANGTEFPEKSVLGYNYPHDFYSLIETAKVDLGLEYYPKQEDKFNFPKLPDDLASSAILDAASTILKSTNNPSSNKNALMSLADEGDE